MRPSSQCYTAEKPPHRVTNMTDNLLFITLMGVVSLFSDMTHEGARSILGPFLSETGASAAAIAVVSGAGELCGYSLRLLSGFVADKTRRYWTLVIAGYALQVASVPALALVGEGGWVAACALVILERVAKAVKKPAKNTLVSFAASGIGWGKGFAYQEVLDQIGAFSGPIMLYIIARIKEATPNAAGAVGGLLANQGSVSSSVGTYRLCFAFLAIPAAITIAFTLIARARYPHPETFEKDEKEAEAFDASDNSGSEQGRAEQTLPEGEAQTGNKALPAGTAGTEKRGAASGKGGGLFADKSRRNLFVLYMVSIALFAFGFADFPLLSLHASRSGAFGSADIALLYALAMFTDALSALLFGTLFDRIGTLSLALSTLAAAAFSPLVFVTGTRGGILAGVALWGVGMGAEESVMKACVSSFVPRDMRSRAFGVAETGFGVAWLLGSIAMGVLYDKSHFAREVASRVGDAVAGGVPQVAEGVVSGVSQVGNAVSSTFGAGASPAYLYALCALSTACLVASSAAAFVMARKAARLAPQ